MGFYIRKSLKAGPFRFNLSKSGIGVSAGIPGFRVSSGPRGNYVNVGAHGVYYRASLNSRPTAVRSRPQPSHHQLHEPRSTYRPDQVLMEDVSGATSFSLEPTGGDDIVEQLNTAARRFGWGWPALITAFVIGAAAMPWGLILWAVAVPACWWLFLRDAARRTVVLFYDVEDGVAGAWFEQFIASWGGLTASQRIWRTVQSGQIGTTYQHKTNAGASSLVNRVTAVASTLGPKHLATNVTIPTLVAGKSSLHFLPDRVLVRDGKRYSDVGYDRLRVRAGQKRFIESLGAMPTDATQVDQTWQYVNVKGGPDRRFANNPRLPIMLYGQLDLQTPEGLDWRLQTSRADATTPLSASLQAAPIRRQLGS